MDIDPPAQLNFLSTLAFPSRALHPQPVLHALLIGSLSAGIKMADIDEAVIHMPSQDASAHIDTDLSDETQDFRMLNRISLSVLPRVSSGPYLIYS